LSRMTEAALPVRLLALRTPLRHGVERRGLLR
jgi:hypothetical protein